MDGAYVSVASIRTNLAPSIKVWPDGSNGNGKGWGYVTTYILSSDS